MSYSYKYLHSVPQALLDEFVQGNVVPVVGAGFSKNADIPAGITMPDWPELAKAAARDIPDYEFQNDPLDTLSYYESLYSRSDLIKLLMKELHIGVIKPNDTYSAFCNVFGDIVCTTNFDFLLENAYRSLNRTVSVITSEDRLPISTPNEVRIVKMHGDFDHPNRMVITERDYDLWAKNNPVLTTYISNLFITKTIFLIGYSLDDYDLRTLWQAANDDLGDMTRPAYCVTVGSGKEKKTRYNRRHVKTINLEGDVKDYKTILRDFFIEIAQYIEETRNPSLPHANPDETIRYIDMSNSEGLCIGDYDHEGCHVHPEESSDRKTVATIDFSLTESKLCSVVHFVTEGKDWSSYLKDDKMLCFDIYADTENVNADVEVHLAGRNIQVSIGITNQVQAFSIPLSRFTKAVETWKETKEICFLFRKKHIRDKVTVTIENLRVE